MLHFVCSNNFFLPCDSLSFLSRDASMIVIIVKSFTNTYYAHSLLFVFVDAIIHSDTPFCFCCNFGFFAKPRETGARGASFVCMLTARFVLKYINVYHEVACDGNLYLVFLDFFHYYYYTFYAWVMSVVRFGRKWFFFSHDISIAIGCPLFPLSAPSSPRQKTARKGLKIYCSLLC